MKKSTFLTTLAFALVMLLSVNVHAQKFSNLDKSPLDIAYYKTDRNAPPMVKVIYSRPQLNGRELSKLAPNGKVWRTGANEATEIKFYQDTNFGGKPVKAGTYSLFTIPGETEWTVILNKDLDVWGAYSYNEANDVVRVKAPVSKGDSVDAFSIAFSDGNMYLAWGTDRVNVSVSK
ncbi:DUF2911 domain-containing protein [Sabulilitoribacter multivorans]|uniref:DUF2911 domain-containing protein n=1 Tax=Flaviramulus multivorans TaxID=1304750 RepID=A0ABS9IKG4_9FLAO|nr:DUF2911 domain-containing protein [Flaviramulus multivorans]MCF7561094.1 DUF2911 domain-containing protein [Flaviramulus multivorans]